MTPTCGSTGPRNLRGYHGKSLKTIVRGFSARPVSSALARGQCQNDVQSVIDFSIGSQTSMRGQRLKAEVMEQSITLLQRDCLAAQRTAAGRRRRGCLHPVRGVRKESQLSSAMNVTRNCCTILSSCRRIWQLSLHWSEAVDSMKSISQGIARNLARVSCFSMKS